MELIAGLAISDGLSAFSMPPAPFVPASFSSACWSGELTHKRCCMGHDPGCWDGMFTPDLCCRPENHTVPWWIAAPSVQTGTQFVMWYLSNRVSCHSSVSVPLEICCHGGGSGCWDSIFSRAKCCNQQTQSSSIPLVTQYQSCWFGAYTYERCCLGPYDGSCWDGEYTQDKCCGGASSSSADAGENLTSLAANVSLFSRNLGKCKAAWQVLLRSAGSITNQYVQEAALRLLSFWRSARQIAHVQHVSPAFLASVALYRAVALMDQGMSQPTEPFAMWTEVQELIMIFRNNFANIDALDLASLPILALDSAVHDRSNVLYHVALQRTLEERIEDASQQISDLGSALGDSFQKAFRELVQVLQEIHIDFVPIQGTLISLLRYGNFPAGRLSVGKHDVVDNDAEVMIFLDNEGDIGVAGTRLSLALESRGWPPCTNPHARKLVCFSMRHAIPCKLEIYVVTKDVKEGIIFSSRTCAAPGQCEYLSTHPLQNWGGRMPLNVIYPMKKCRIGSLEWSAPCPNLPMQFLLGYNGGEYERQSVVPMKPDQNGRSDDVGAVAAANPPSTSCLALPVISKDRDMGDARNQRLEREGLTMLDLYFLHSYARALHKRGFVSFHDHLSDPPCVRRQWAIFYDSPRFELSRLDATK